MRAERDGSDSGDVISEDGRTGTDEYRNKHQQPSQYGEELCFLQTGRRQNQTRTVRGGTEVGTSEQVEFIRKLRLRTGGCGCPVCPQVALHLLELVP